MALDPHHVFYLIPAYWASKCEGNEAYFSHLANRIVNCERTLQKAAERKVANLFATGRAAKAFKHQHSTTRSSHDT